MAKKIIPSRPQVLNVTTAAIVVPANPRRMFVSFVNTGATNNISLGLGAEPPAGGGTVLYPNGGSYIIDKNNYFNGDIYGLSTTTTLAIQEVSLGLTE